MSLSSPSKDYGLVEIIIPLSEVTSLHRLHFYNHHLGMKDSQIDDKHGALQTILCNMQYILYGFFLLIFHLAKALPGSVLSIED